MHPWSIPPGLSPSTFQAPSSRPSVTSFSPTDELTAYDDGDVGELGPGRMGGKGPRLFDGRLDSLAAGCRITWSQPPSPHHSLFHAISSSVAPCPDRLAAAAPTT